MHICTVKKGIYILLIHVGCAINSFAQQKDTLQGVLEETVVTATRSERKLSNVAVPVTIIPQKIIQQSASLRLNDILQEQTGLFLTAGSGSNAVGGGIFGNGVQLQGLAPDYTMILLDGEPLIGRQGGVMDVSRFAVGNIKKIEIVKGPSSSLYGSEAMGGVINLITDPLQGKQANIGVRYGSFATSDIFTSGNYSNQKQSLYYFANRNASNGYELDKKSPEKTADAYHNYTAQIKYTYRLTANTQFIFNNRYYNSWQKSEYAVNSNAINVSGGAKNIDYTLNPVVLHQFSKNIKGRLSVLYSKYAYKQDLNNIVNNSKYYFDNFVQEFLRVENLTDFTIKNHQLTVGGGYTLQEVNTTRYKEIKQQHIYHAFVQNEWKALEKLRVIAGVRYDHNTDFKSRFSPKIAMKYTINQNFSVSSSFGYGFKAPDFRQLYLNFVNAAGDGYSLYGASEFSIAEMIRQQNIGLVAQILPAAYQITTLKPEISQGLHIGLQFKNQKKLQADINLFRNDIDNLINYIPVATNANGTSVFSYVNINRAYTQGIEGNIQYKLSSNIGLAVGYQYLETADKQLLNNVNNGTVFGRNEQTGIAYLLTRKEYSGLLNRSKHMANIRLFYENKNGWMASIRGMYRSKWGVVDKDGNGFANRDDEFANAVVHVNATVSKKIKDTWLFQVGANNILNTVNAQYLPNIPGVNFFTSITHTFKYNKK